MNDPKFDLDFQLNTALHWLLLSGFLFGGTERSIAVLANGYPDAGELSQLFTVLFCLFTVIRLKPRL